MIRLALAGATGRMGRCLLELALRDTRFEVVAGLTKPGCAHAGQTQYLAEREVLITEALDATPDVLIDFTVADGTMAWLEVCQQRCIPMVIGATGHSGEQLERIRGATKRIPILNAGNFSFGIAAILEMIDPLVRTLGEGYDVEIIETHHRHKVDAPSGTSLAVVEAIRAARAKMKSPRVGKSNCPNPEDAEPGVIFGRRGECGERPIGQIAVHAVRMGEIVGQHEIHLSGPGETITIRHVAHTRETFASGALRAAAWIVGKSPGLYTMRDVLKG